MQGLRYYYLKEGVGHIDFGHQTDYSFSCIQCFLQIWSAMVVCNPFLKGFILLLIKCVRRISILYLCFMSLRNLLTVVRYTAAVHLSVK